MFHLRPIEFRTVLAAVTSRAHIGDMILAYPGDDYVRVVLVVVSTDDEEYHNWEWALEYKKDESPINGGMGLCVVKIAGINGFTIPFDCGDMGIYLE